MNALLITMHDSGKINLSEEILTKDGPLTEEEWSEVRTHPEPGFRIARATEESAHMADDMLARITTMAAMLTVPRSEQIKSSN